MMRIAQPIGFFAAALLGLAACSPRLVLESCPVPDPRMEEWVKQITARVNEHEQRLDTVENAMKLAELGRLTLIPKAKGD